ncbi:MAG: SDR family oxidoreductase [Elusimicrobia bacterium]|nr:SDR family oxidoreductase [Elusimicrobiota bacterium]
MVKPWSAGPVFITGAASGIGRALAREFLKEGARVVAVDRDLAALAELSKEAALMGFSIATCAADVGDRDAFLRALELAADAHGSPAVFVNNAGVARVGAFAAGGLDAFDAVLRVNLNGVAHGTYFALSRMEAAGGLVVNVSSLAGQLPAAFMASYSASKFGVVGFTRALQAELEMSHSRVRVALVCPGFIDTPIMRQEGAPFPWYLRWLVDTPASAARAIVRGLKSGRAEIYPDAGGRLMRRAGWLAPRLTLKASRLLLARNLSQMLGLEPILPGKR